MIFNSITMKESQITWIHGIKVNGTSNKNSKDSESRTLSGS